MSDRTKSVAPGAPPALRIKCPPLSAPVICNGVARKEIGCAATLTRFPSLKPDSAAL